MNGFWGADAEALRTMGAVCARRAELLDELEGRLSAVIDTVEWVGEDAERFRADWSGSVRPGLQDRGLELRQQARRLAQHAEEQEAASSPDSFGGPWSSPGEFLADTARMAQGMLRDLLGGGALGGEGGPAGRFAEMLREALATDEGRAALLGAFLGSLLGGLLADLVLRGLALGMLLEELLAGLGAGGGLGNLIGEEGRLGEGPGGGEAGGGAGAESGSGTGSESAGGSDGSSSGAGQPTSGGAGGESGGGSEGGSSSGGGSGGGGAEGTGGSDGAEAGAAGTGSEAPAQGGAMGLQGLVDGPAQSAGSLPAGRLEAPGAEEHGTLFERLVAMIGEMLGGATGGDAPSPRGASAIGEGIGWG
ncbi:hypothetical protein ACH0CV_09680 [Brachybacterium paraconglomeratum]|uniref:hypothetical protein n=1 Tax=Brachybacterium paraconglomeratum TaxID=173362 RepID=UPI0021A79D6B|nr:hypothetical protein [Brachybacterium paraconglomeratum]MCT1908089.1 hypothetical protein [Brachybacterium paraconglomeratum]